MSKKKIVIKIGSNLLAENFSVIEWLADEVKTLMNGGYFPVVVTSGAVAAGKVARKISKPTSLLSLAEKQALAAIGQPILMSAYREIFLKKSGVGVAQVLLTRSDFMSRPRFSSIRATLLALVDYGVIPVINENDTVATEEIRFGDNDELSAIVAAKIGADKLVLLTDVEGLYNGDFRRENLIRIVEKITPSIKKMASKGATKHGSGGMISKIRAAEIATAAGITAIVGRPYGGFFSDVISMDNTMLKEQNMPPVQGSVFLPARLAVGLLKKSSADEAAHMDAKQCWIAFGAKPRGAVIIDEGAAQALVRGGKSLLASGVVGVRGDFSKGDVVQVIVGKSAGTESSKEPLARGIVNYSSCELSKIKGARSRDIPRLLDGDENSAAKEVVHRDNLVILNS